MGDPLLAKHARLKNIGLLVIRLGLGIMFLLHGWPKLSGGPAKWEMLGHQMEHLGITFWPVFWGGLAAVTEFFGGIFMILGFLFRPIMLLLCGTMLVATVMHVSEGHDFVKIAHPVEVGITFLGLLIAGPGRYSIDAHWKRKRRSRYGGTLSM